MFSEIPQAIYEALAPFSGKKVYLGFSGGADSSALLFGARSAAKKLDIELTAVHFEHGLRGNDSLKDAEWTKTICAKQEINYLEYSLNTLDNCLPSESLEAAARRLRLAKYQELAGATDAVVLLGHHRDDCIENMFIRLCRGSNVSGVTSLRQINMIGKVTFLRPLLGFTKAQLLDYLKYIGVIYWCTDKSNFETDYVRNFFRNKLIPSIESQVPTANSGLAKAVQMLEIDAKFVESQAEIAAQSVLKKHSTKRSFWLELPDALFPRVLRKWLSSLSKTEFLPNYNLITRFKQMIQESCECPKLIPLTTNKFIRLHRDEINYFSGNQVTQQEKLWDWKTDPTFKYGGERFKVIISDGALWSKVNDQAAIFDFDLLPDKILFTRRGEGDKITPFGSKTPQKLKKILINKKLTASEKEQLIVMRNLDGEILWVPYVRHSALASISSETKRTVYIELLD